MINDGEMIMSYGELESEVFPASETTAGNKGNIEDSSGILL